MDMNNDSFERNQKKYARHRKTLEERSRKRAERLQRPYGQVMGLRLFLLVLVLGIVFGGFDIVRVVTDPYLAIRWGTIAATCLIGAALPGIPLVVVCVVQLRKIRSGAIKEEAVNYRLWLRVTAGILVALALAMVATLLLGV